MVRRGALLLVFASLWLGGTARAACTLGQIAELPITVAHLRPLVPAKINGTDVWLIADSGAFFSMLSPAGAASLHLDAAPLPFGVTFSGVGGEFSASVARVKAFTLPNSILPDVDFVVGGSDIETPAVGLIGQNLLGSAMSTTISPTGLSG